MKKVDQEKLQDYWMTHMAKRRSLGLSRVKYCKANDLKIPQMTYWERQLDGLKETPLIRRRKRTQHNFVKAVISNDETPVKVATPSTSSVSNFPALRMTFAGGFQLDFANGAEVQWIAGLVVVMRGL